VSAKAKAVIAANMGRFEAAKAAMPWSGIYTANQFEVDWGLVEECDRMFDRFDGVTATTTVPVGTATAKGK
jgi:hypothetical protein